MKGNRSEIAIAKWFSNSFGVTFSKEGFFKEKTYTFDFLQPNDDMKRNFNLSNEVLLLFSYYPSFDTRTFDLVDKTLEEFSNRLDKLCVFIVSNDDNFIQRITKLMSDQKDFRLVVPFTYSEILNNRIDESGLYQRMREYLYDRDLFAFESPLRKDDYFFGRNNIVQQLYQKYSSGEQSGLFGLRKIGKTSVLYALQRTIEYRDGLSIYIDCQSPAIHMARWYKLLEIIIRKIAETNGRNEILADLNYNEKNAATLFENNVKHLYSSLGNKRILFIFDEIECITYGLATQEHWRTENDFLYFWQTIRSVYQNNRIFFSFIIAGVNPYIVEVTTINKTDNPIFSMITPVYLEFFRFQDVKQMASSIGGYMGISFEEEVFTYLIEDYGGHPFLIRQVCSLINNSATQKPFKVDKLTYKQSKLDYDKKIAPYVSLIVNVLREWYPRELELLSILATHGNDGLKKHIKNQIEINHLLGYGILAEKNGRYFITINAILEYLSSIPNGYIPEKNDERWACVSKRRNAIETKLRSIIKITLEAQKGKGSTKNILLGIIDSAIRIKIKSMNTDVILSDYIFFIQLKSLIENHWQLFSNIFIDKSMFAICMEIINRHRIDAHAKHIDDADYFQLNYALKWIEEKIE